MVSDVKIDNVGGPRPQLGVASEATLQALLDATTGAQRTERDRRRIQETYDRSVRDTTQSQGIFKRAIVSGAASVYNFGKELAFGGDRATDFADAVFGSTSRVTKLTRYLDDNIDTWRTLSSVGASFNNSIVDMISSAANSAMNIDSFTSMVRNNSEQLARFGTTATQGAKFLGEFSKDFRLGVGVQFLEMGFTIEDVNEGLIGFMALERQRSTAALRSDRAQQEAAAQYLLSLDKLTKVTGKQRKTVEDALSKQMQDAGIRSQLNRLEGQARTNLQETLAFLDTELQGPLADGLKDLMDGVAHDDLGKALQNQIPGITEFAQRMFRGGASLDEVINQLGNDFGPQLEIIAANISQAQLTSMRQAGGVTAAIAEILDSAYQLNQLTGRDVEAARREQERREPLTAALGKFENAIIQLRKQFVDAFFDIVNVPGGLVDAFSDLGDFLMSWIEPGANSLTGFVPTIRGLIDMLFGPTGWVSIGVRKFTKYLREGGLQKAFDNVKEAFNSVKDWITEFIGDVETEGFFPTIQARFIDLIEEVKTQWQNIFSDTGNGTGWQDRIGNYIKDILYGKEITAGPMNQVVGREGGLIKTITDGFTKLFDKASTALINLIGLDTDSTAPSYLDQILQRIGLDTDSTAPSYLDQIMKKMEDALLGKEVEVREGPEIHLERQGGLIKTITDGFTKLFEDTTTALANLIGLDTDSTAPSYLDQILQRIGLDTDSTAPSYLDQIMKKMEDALLGKEVQVGRADDRRIERQGGLLTSLINGISDLFNRQEIITAMTNAIKDLATATLNGLTDFWNAPENAAKIDNMIDSLKLTLEAGLIELLELLNTGFAGWFIDDENLAQRRADYEAAQLGQSSDPANAARRDALIQALQSELQQLNTPIERPSFDEFGGTYVEPLDTERIAAIRRQLELLGVEGFNRGTNGFQDFGKGTLSMLHGTEAVVPRNTPAGELLNQFFNKANNENSATTIPTSSQTNQSDLSSKIDQLNTVMSRVAVLMEASVGVQTRTMQNIKGLSTDIIKGIPR